MDTVGFAWFRKLTDKYQHGDEECQNQEQPDAEFDGSMFDLLHLVGKVRVYVALPRFGREPIFHVTLGALIDRTAPPTRHLAR